MIKSSNNIEICDHAILQQRIILRGDLAKVSIGKYVILSEMVVIKPPTKRQNKELRYVPTNIGNYVFVDKGTIIEAMSIGNYVKIGRDCILGQRVVIGDNSIILDNSVVCPDTFIAPYSVYGGKPAVYMGELPETFPLVQKESCQKYF